MYNAVIYNVNTGKITRYFGTLRGAKSSLTRMLKKLANAPATRGELDNGLALMAVSIADYDKTGGKTANEMVEVVSIFGKTVEIRRADVGGCCDPSTETYWSM